MRRYVWLALCGVLAACQMNNTGAPKANVIAGDAIETTSLDSDTPVAIETAPPLAPDQAVADAPLAPLSDTIADAEATVPDAAAPEAEPAPAEPVAIKSESQQRCEARGGVFASVGGEGARACVQPTRDGGKSCRREGDCEGQCLARSQSCSPIEPLLGCNDVLQQNGAMVTLCVN